MSESTGRQSRQDPWVQRGERQSPACHEHLSNLGERGGRELEPKILS